MTATDELHRLLTEAGVEYQFNDATKIFEWHYDGTYGEGFAHATEAHGGINIIACSLTPEQVIAATLGRDNVGEYVGLRRGEYWERSENSDCYCGGCGWKVTDHDSYCPECGGALHEATLGDTDATQARQDVAADVDEIIEHVINGNMLSMPYDVYVELFDAVDGLGVKVEKLQAENARLRDLMYERAHVHAIQNMTEDELRITAANALDDNARLRDLLRDYDKCLDTALMLAREAGYQVMPDQKLFDSLRPRMRELGVEVDG